MKDRFGLHQSLYFALGIVIMKSVALLMLPIVTHYLTPAQFGALEFLLSISDFATILVGFALVEGLYRFAGASGSDEQEQRFAATIFGLSAIAAGSCFIFGMLLAPMVHPMFDDGISLLDLQLLVFLFSVDPCLVIPLGWLKLKENGFGFFVLTTSKGIAQAVISWQLLSAGYGITAILLGGAITSIVLVIVLAKLQISQSGIKLELKLLPQLLGYCTPLVISGMAAFALLSADRWVITMVSTTSELGLYALGKKLALISVLMMQPFVLWWSAVRFKQLNLPDGHKTTADTVSFGIALVMCFSAFVCISAPIFVQLMLNAAYADAMVYLPMLALIYAVKQIAELANLGSYIGKTTWNVMAIDLTAAAVSIVCLYFFSQKWQIAGVIAALLCSQCLRAVLFYFSSQRKLHLAYAKFRLLLLAILCFGLTYVSLQISSLAQHFVLLFTATVLLAAYLHLSQLYCFTPMFKRLALMLKPATGVDQ